MTLSASLASDTRYETVIALRNIAWADFRAAEQLLRDVELAVQMGLLLPDGARQFRSKYNRAMDDYERARTELARIKAWRRRQ